MAGLLLLLNACGGRQAAPGLPPAPELPDTHVAVQDGVDVPTDEGAGDAAGADPGTRSPDADVDTPPPPIIVATNDRDMKQAALTLIDGAKTRVDVFHFEFVQTGSVIDVRNALLAAAAKGVEVRVLLDDEVDDNTAAVAILTDGGVDAKIDGHKTRVHLKMMAADAKVVLIGSTNLSGASFDFNHETNVVVREPSAVAFLQSYLDALWKDQGHDPSETTGPVAAASGVVPWVDGGYFSLAMPAIEAAKERVDLIVYGLNLNFNYPDGPLMALGKALEAAEDRGVDVRVLLEKSSWNWSLNKLNDEAASWLVNRGVWVRFDSEDVVTHAKLLICDGKVLVGTNNWSYNGLELDHEAGVMFTTESAVADFKTYFEARFNAGDDF